MSFSEKTLPKAAHPVTTQLHAHVKNTLDFGDTQDFEDVHRGFIGTLDDPIIRKANGDVVWDLKAYQFLDQSEAPDTVNPSLWRQARLNYVHGLFKVTERIYQVRGFDLANITFVETEHGLIVIDPLTFEESARAALELYWKHRGQRPVQVVIYSHSHRDHFGGVRGVVDEQDVLGGKVQIIAPEHFMQEAVSEAVFAGVPMRRRAQFQFGIPLAPGVRTHVDCGLGKAVGRGTSGLIAPTRLIKDAHESMNIDGIDIEFQLTPGTEAPAEMNFWFPQLRALNMAENACHTMHNLCPLRGAKIRDTLAWARYLDESIERYAGEADVVYAQHHWPLWGRERVRHFLVDQRDLYRYLHDQTLRWMAHGLTASEISEQLMIPDEISLKWHNRGYYGAVVHNVRAIYAWYMGPYDGNPATLDPLPPVAAGHKYMEYMGGIDAVVQRARQDYDRGEFRWVIQLMNHAIFSQPQHREARELAANAYEQLGYQTECATWRNSYLLAAQELRIHAAQSPGQVVAGNTISLEMISVLPVEMLLDYLAIRIKGDEVHSLHYRFDWHMTDEASTYQLTLKNGVLTHRPGSHSTHGAPADATIRTHRTALTQALKNQQNLLSAVSAGLLQVEGNRDMVCHFLSNLENFAPMFGVVEP